MQSCLPSFYTATLSAGLFGKMGTARQGRSTKRARPATHANLRAMSTWKGGTGEDVRRGLHPVS
jgi:hypothetical protein